MTFRRISARIVIVMIFCSAVRMHAGSLASNPEMTVRLMSWEGDLPDLWVADGSSFLPARAGEFVLGRPLFLERKTENLRIFREETVDGVSKKVKVADVALPDGTASALVVLAPVAAGGSRALQGRALDQSLAAHPLNTVRIVNFSTKTIAVRVGEKNTMIAQGEDGIFPFPADGTPRVPVELAVETPGGWQMVQRSLQPAPAGRRILVVTRDGRPDFSIHDPSLRTRPVDAVFLIDRAPPASVLVAKK